MENPNIHLVIRHVHKGVVNSSLTTYTEFSQIHLLHASEAPKCCHVMEVLAGLEKL